MSIVRASLLIGLVALSVSVPADAQQRRRARPAPRPAATAPAQPEAPRAPVVSAQDESAYRLIIGRGEAAFARGDYVEALARSNEALEFAQTRFGAGSRFVYQSLNDISVIHQMQGRLDLALPIALRAAGGLERIAGPSHPETLNALGNLGQLYVQLNRGAEAEPLLRRVFRANETARGLANEATLNALLELAIYLSSQRRLPEILPDLERGAAAARTALGETSGQARDLADATTAARRAAGIATPAPTPAPAPAPGNAQAPAPPPATGNPTS